MNLSTPLPGIAEKKFADLFLSFDATNHPAIAARQPYPCKKSIQWGDASGNVQYFEATQDQFQFFQTETWQGLLLGELFNYKDQHLSQQELIQTIAKDLQEGQLDAAAINGHCIFFAFDQKHQNYHVWTNRLGTYHAYYSQAQKRNAIGTSYYAVVRSLNHKSLDWEAINSFFVCGFFPAEHTYFKEVKIFQPATHYVFDVKGKLLIAKRYWHWKYKPDHKRNHQDCVEEFCAIFKKIVAEYAVTDRLILPLSGGLDSRLIAATLEAIKSKNPLWAFSYGYSNDSAEIKIGEKIAKAIQCDHQAFVIEPYLFSKQQAILAATEGFQDMTLPRQAFVADELGKHGNFILCGHWGDVWFDDMGTQKLSLKNDEDFQNYLFQKMSKQGHQWLWQNFGPKENVFRNPQELAMHLFKTGLENVRSIEDPDFRIKAFKTDYWSFRWTLASVRMYQMGATPRLPFYDNRIVDFFLTVPTDYVAKRSLEIDCIKALAPELARIKWQVYDADLYHYQYFNNLHIPKRILAKLGRFITEKRIERNWEVQFLSSSGRRALEDFFNSQLKLYTFISPETTKELLAKFYAAPFQNHQGYTLAMLFTFAQMLEYFDQDLK